MNDASSFVSNYLFLPTLFLNYNFDYKTKMSLTQDDEDVHASSEVNNEDIEDDDEIDGEDTEDTEEAEEQIKTEESSTSNASASTTTASAVNERDNKKKTSSPQITSKIKDAFTYAGNIGKKAATVVVNKTTSPIQQQQAPPPHPLHSTRIRYLRENNFAAQKTLYNGYSQYLRDVNQKVVDLNPSLTNSLSLSQEISFNIRTIHENLAALNNACRDLSLEYPRVLQIL
jgi:hypothetical protein